MFTITLRLRVYNIEGKIFLKLSTHFVNIKQSSPSRVKTLIPEQNKQTLNSPISLCTKQTKQETLIVINKQLKFNS